MLRLLRWMLRQELKTVKLRKDETLIVCIKEDLSQEDLETFVSSIPKKISEKVVFIGGVDTVIVA